MPDKSPKDQNSPRVSIIMLNWNQMEVTSDCLNSLEHISYPNFEVLVVDQASDNQEGRELQKRFPWIQIIQSESNLGFTGGNNLALQQSTGELVLLLNNDTEVPTGFLEPLVHAFQSDPRLGITSPKILYFQTANLIQYAGCDDLNPYTMRGSTRGYHEIDEGQHDEARFVHFAHGAAMMIRSDVFKEIGLLADQFFVYYEELDFCKRARAAGWSIKYVPESNVFHKESVTMGKNSPSKTYFMTRNRIMYLRRNCTLFPKMIALGFVCGIALPFHWVRFILTRQFKHSAALLKGAMWHTTHFNVQQNSYLTRNPEVPA